VEESKEEDKINGFLVTKVIDCGHGIDWANKKSNLFSTFSFNKKGTDQLKG
jgi:hypothetical protein